MENASKALVIAGAILISILLVSVGIMIFSGASGIFNQGKSALNGQDRDLFNQQFTIYEGTVSGPQLEQLVKKVMATKGSNLQEVHIGGANPSVSTKCKMINSTEVFKTEDQVKGTTSFGTEQSIVSMKSYQVKCYYNDGIVVNIGVKQL